MNEKLKSLKSFLRFVLILACVLCTEQATMRISIVQGESMESTLEDSDILFVWLPSDIELYDIVIIDPDDLDHMLVKRVVALPGDTVQIFDGFLYVNGEFMGNDVYCDEAMNDAGIAKNPIVLGDDQYFVLGDNRNNSSDSRYLGAFDEDEILGVVKARLFPEFTIF